MNGLEGISVVRWVWTTLTTDPTLQGLLGGTQASAEARVWEGVAPEGTGTPWVVFTVVEPRDVKVVGLAQVFAMVQVQVKVVGKATSYGPLLPVYQRVHELLDGKTNQVVVDGVVLTSERVSGIQFPERVNGIEYRHLGGLYETHTQ